MGLARTVSALIAVVAAALIAWLHPPVHWPPLPDRLAVIDGDAIRIDNVRPYSSIDKWSRDGAMAGLHAMNPARVAYFDAEIRAFLGNDGSFRVLDMGCGGGLVSNALAQLPGYGAIEGVDLSPEALAFANSTASAAVASAVEDRAARLPKVRFQKASVYEVPFDAASFDAVVISDVLEHLTDLRRVLAEVRRVLRPGGVFVFDTLSRTPLAYLVAILGAECLFGVVERGAHDWRLFIRPEELERALLDAGFGSFTYQALTPTPRALIDLAAFGLGFRPGSAVTGGFFVEKPPPQPLIVSYIGRAVAPP